MSEAEQLAKQDGPNGPSAAVVESGPKEKTLDPKKRPKFLPPYKVILHNDDVNTIEYVVTSICRITTLSAEDAVLRTLEAHDGGLSVLLTTHKERAELYQEQFTSVKLTVTIEAE